MARLPISVPHTLLLRGSLEVLEADTFPGGRLLDLSLLLIIHLDGLEGAQTTLVRLFNLFFGDILRKCRLSMLHVTIALRRSDYSCLCVNAGEEVVQQTLSVLQTCSRTFDISSDIPSQFAFELLIEGIEGVEHAFESLKRVHFGFSSRRSWDH
jgi:hypothetical protein